jgi:hypothetical protein
MATAQLCPTGLSACRVRADSDDYEVSRSRAVSTPQSRCGALRVARYQGRQSNADPKYCACCSVQSFGTSRISAVPRHSERAGIMRRLPSRRGRSTATGQHSRLPAWIKHRYHLQLWSRVSVNVFSDMCPCYNLLSKQLNDMSASLLLTQRYLGSCTSIRSKSFPDGEEAICYQGRCLVFYLAVTFRSGLCNHVPVRVQVHMHWQSKRACWTMLLLPRQGLPLALEPQLRAIRGGLLQRMA